MYLNATFIVQIINFLITYFFLERVLFGPFVAHIEKKKKDVDSLNKEIQTQELCLVELEHEKVKNLAEFQNYIHHKCKIKPLPTLEIHAQPTKMYSKEELAQHTTRIANLLNERIPHDFQA